MKSLETRLQRLEAARRAHTPFDYMAEFGLSKSRFEQSVIVITKARNNSVCRVVERGEFFKRTACDPAPYEPEPPADFTQTEIKAFRQVAEYLLEINSSI